MAVKSGQYDELMMIALDELVTPAPCDRIDLLHIDIQGGEADLHRRLPTSMHGKDQHFLLVGTHSAKSKVASWRRCFAPGGN